MKHASSASCSFCALTPPTTSALTLLHPLRRLLILTSHLLLPTHISLQPRFFHPHPLYPILSSSSSLSNPSLPADSPPESSPSSFSARHFSDSLSTLRPPLTSSPSCFVPVCPYFLYIRSCIRKLACCCVFEAQCRSFMLSISKCAFWTRLTVLHVQCLQTSDGRH